MRNKLLFVGLGIFSFSFFHFVFPLQKIQARTPDYEEIHLGSLGGGDTHPTALNNKGQIIGTSNDVDGIAHAFLWENGVMTQIDGFLNARDINEKGQIVGNGFLWDHGVLTYLGTLGGTQVEARAINNNGQVIGLSSTSGDQFRHAFLWQDGIMTDIGNFDALDINDAGQVVGYGSISCCAQHAMLWQNGVRTDLGSFGSSPSPSHGDLSIAYSINEQGEIVGMSTTSQDYIHAALWKNGGMSDLGTLGGESSSAVAINNNSDIIGSSNEEIHGFGYTTLWSDGEIINLHTGGPQDINDEGSYIDGSYYYKIHKPTVGDFVLFGKEGLWMKSGSSVISGDVGANTQSNGPFLDSNVEVSIGNNVSFPNSLSKIYGDSLKIKDGAQVYDVFYNDISGDGTILGSQTHPQSLPVVYSLPTLPDFTHGTNDVTISAGANASLSEGTYGNLLVIHDATLTLLGGVYNFDNWDIRSGATIYVTSPVEIRIDDKLGTGDHVNILPSPGSSVGASDIKIYINGKNGSTGNLGATPKAAEFGIHSSTKANVYVPNGTLWIKDSSVGVGAFLGKWAIAGQSSQFSLDSSF